MKHNVVKKMDVGNFQKEADIAGDDEEDTAPFRSMAAEVREYLAQFTWVPPIESVYFAGGVGGVVGVFLVEFVTSIQEPDKYLWVVVGDLPSAYLVIDDLPDAKEALEVYCELMQD